MRVIHLSDLHYTGKDKNQEKLLLALSRDIHRMNQDKHIDIVVVTGDIASHGNTQNEIMVKAYDSFITSVSSSIGENTEILVCPGNHDVDLSALDKIYRPIFDNVKNPKNASELSEQAIDEKSFLWAHLSGFISFAKRVDARAYADNKLFYVRRFVAPEMPTIEVGIASFNSAWMTSGGGIRDHGQLYIGAYQVDSALEKLDGCGLKIALMHHSPDWLNPTERSGIMRTISTHFDAILCGHNHDNTARQETTNIGAIFISNTGCLYGSAEYFNGYSILDFDNPSQKITVTAREYYYQRDEFDSAPRFSSDGKKEYNYPRRDGVMSVQIPADIELTIHTNANSRLLSYAASDVAPKDIDNIFVEPLMATIPEHQFDIKSSKKKGAEYMSVPEVCNLAGNIVIRGKRESGKTTLLYHIALSCFNILSRDAYFGLVLDIQTIDIVNEPNIIKHLVSELNGDIRRQDMIHLLDQGLVTVCFDNVDFNISSQREEIDKFCSRFNRVRVILSMVEEVVDDLRPGYNDKHFENFSTIFIHSFKRKQIRILSSKWFGSESVLGNHHETVIRLLDMLNIPRTPFIVSVLLWVLEQRMEYSLVNKATAIDLLINGLLDRFNETASREVNDSIIKSHFLSDFAFILDHSNSEWMSEIRFEELVVSYFQERLLPGPTDTFRNTLFNNGLLYKFRGRISFKFDCFRAYFLSKKFSIGEEFLVNCINSTSIHKYVDELDFYTGLNRDDAIILRKCIDTCKELSSESGFNEAVLKYRKSESTLPPIDGNGILSMFGDILETDYSESDRENLLSKMERPTPASLDHTASRKRIIANSGDISQNIRLLESFRALSIIVRNSELVSDVKIRMEALNLVLSFWSSLMKMIIHELNNNEIFSNDDQTERTDKHREIVNMLMPQLIIAILYDNLLTPKLRLYNEEIIDTSVDIIVKIFSALLLFGSDIRRGKDKLLSVIGSVGGDKFLLQVIFLKLTTIYYIEPLNNSSKSILKSVIAETLVALGVAKTNNENKARRYFITQIEKRDADRKRDECEAS